ncbi:MAG: cytochrome [Acidobacteriota bacterium]|nr:cytochrome [Acidobacteriota bacterium]
MEARAIVIGVMGAGAGASEEDVKRALELGAAIASRGWVTLSGGRDAGVMAAVNRAASSAGGLTLGLLPGEKRQAAPGVVLALPTGLGSARNNVNVLASDAVVVLADRIGPGTTSEAALAVKAGRPLIIITEDETTKKFFQSLGGPRVSFAGDATDAMEQLDGLVDELLKGSQLLPLGALKKSTKRC